MVDNNAVDLEYSKNNAKTSGIQLKYYKDISTDHITNSESFKYKASITGKIANNENTKDAEFSVPLKHLRNFWRTLDIPLINCEVNLIFTWSKNCVLTVVTTNAAVPAQEDVPAIPAIAGIYYN